ncbi:intraflagellar transport protein 25 homolog isoform X2 [Erythrolamprus reginae]|uniref:intraflagellar transport protein 25 homolog isoform X2 n=1 Tax=Erythrolamprus reginae TaxID=121349 RepID=UPI00396C3B64
MKLTNYCLSSEGADVILATSSDEMYPAENIIDGRSETFWTTTGMFPQEFIISFHKCVTISKLTIQCCLADQFLSCLSGGIHLLNMRGSETARGEALTCEWRELTHTKRCNVNQWRR